MEMNNRHLKPKPGGYFTIQSPMGKSIGVQSNYHRHRHYTVEKDSRHESSIVTEDGQSGSHSGASNSIGNPVTPAIVSGGSNPPGSVSQITTSITQPGSQSQQQQVVLQQSSTSLCQLTAGGV